MVSVENGKNHEKEIAHIDYSVTQSCHQIKLLKYEFVWDKAENQMPWDEWNQIDPHALPAHCDSQHGTSLFWARILFDARLSVHSSFLD